MNHGHQGLRPEHLHAYDQNHTAAVRQLGDMIKTHKAHIDEGCTTSVSTACLTGQLITIVQSDPFAAAVILGVAIEKLAPHWGRS